MRKRISVLLAVLLMFVLAVGCGAPAEVQEEDFSGVWEGTITLEGLRMPGKMVLDLGSDGRGSARLGFVDQLTQGSIEVYLDKQYGLKGSGTADNMGFAISGRFYELEDEWVFSGELIIEEGDETSQTTVEFFREGSTMVPNLMNATGLEVSPEAWGNTADFSGEWTGTQLVAEVRGENTQDYAEIEGAIFDCYLVLSLPDYSTGTADLYISDELSGPELSAVAAHDRLTLTGLLWGDPFEWYGTFEYDNDEGRWTLTGGGDVADAAEGVAFHLVLKLSKDDLFANPANQQASQSVDVDAPLEEFLIGSWMREASSVVSERTVHTLSADGKAKMELGLPGEGDTAQTWHTGMWKKDVSTEGTWRIEGKRLIVSYENELVSFETDVEVISANAIKIEELHSRRLYERIS